MDTMSNEIAILRTEAEVFIRCLAVSIGTISSSRSFSLKGKRIEQEATEAAENQRFRRNVQLPTGVNEKVLFFRRNLFSLRFVAPTGATQSTYPSRKRYRAGVL